MTYFVFTETHREVTVHKIYKVVEGINLHEIKVERDIIKAWINTLQVECSRDKGSTIYKHYAARVLQPRLRCNKTRRLLQLGDKGTLAGAVVIITEHFQKTTCWLYVVISY